MSDYDILSLSDLIPCPFCQTPNSVSLKDLGKTIKCSKCNADIRLPRTVNVADADSEIAEAIIAAGIQTI